jgi:hypothetical protein
MTAAIIAADVAIGAACVAGLVLLAYLLHRDRHLIGRPGKPMPDMPADALIRALGTRLLLSNPRIRRRSRQNVRGQPGTETPALE